MVSARDITLAAARRRIIQLLTANPARSGRSVISQIRSEGLRGGNERLRDLITIARERAQQGDRGQSDLDIVLDLPVISAGRQERLILAAGAKRRRGLRTTTRGRGVAEVTHIAVQWELEYTAVISRYGQEIERRSGMAEGKFVQPVERFTRELVDSRVAQAADGQITQDFTGGPDSYYEGLTIEYVRWIVRIHTGGTELR